jgi:hypothetical protein
METSHFKIMRIMKSRIKNKQTLMKLNNLMKIKINLICLKMLKAI